VRFWKPLFAGLTCRTTAATRPQPYSVQDFHRHLARHIRGPEVATGVVVGEGFVVEAEERRIAEESHCPERLRGEGVLASSRA